jgi:DNA replication initiation complex subunit (GINS family)
VYKELYAAWQIEIENSELGRLPSDFYARLASYLSNIDEARKAASEKNLKANLLEHEAANVKRMIEDLLSTRYQKIVKLMVTEQKVPTENLAADEVNLCNNLSVSTDAYTQFKAALLRGQAVAPIEVPVVVKVVEAPKGDIVKTPAKPAVVDCVPVVAVASVVAHKRVALRFLQPVPSIIGSDMKTYGPFLVEDVASVPESNAKILVKQGLAKIAELP